MNRTIKDAAIQRHHDADHAQLHGRRANSVNAYKDARRRKTLRGLTPFEFITKRSTKEPERFRLNPPHYTAGLNGGATSQVSWAMAPVVLLHPADQGHAEAEAGVPFGDPVDDPLLQADGIEVIHIPGHTAAARASVPARRLRRRRLRAGARQRLARAAGGSRKKCLPDLVSHFKASVRKRA